VMQDSSGALTETGRKMARLPVDPPFAATLLAAAELQCASDAVAVVALLSSDRVMLTPSSRCDFLSFLLCQQIADLRISSSSSATHLPFHCSWIQFHC
jgi:HrpA-like RNA helicase